VFGLTTFVYRTRQQHGITGTSTREDHSTIGSKHFISR